MRIQLHNDGYCESVSSCLSLYLVLLSLWPCMVVTLARLLTSLSCDDSVLCTDHKGPDPVATRPLSSSLLSANGRSVSRWWSIQQTARVAEPSVTAHWSWPARRAHAVTTGDTAGSRVTMPISDVYPNMACNCRPTVFVTSGVPFGPRQMALLKSAKEAKEITAGVCDCCDNPCVAIVGQWCLARITLLVCGPLYSGTLMEVFLLVTSWGHGGCCYCLHCSMLFFWPGGQAPNCVKAHRGP